jgi:ATP-dependent HslUV protease ATP-binding subunit HslU
MDHLENLLTPAQIVAELDKYIIGQTDAKKNVAIALRNRWRRMTAQADMRQEITPNNILMIGATGVGKTEIARRLARLAGAPFTKVEASKFTEVGYVGRDVESMVRDLAEQSVHMVRAQKKELLKDRAEEAVNEALLEILIPKTKKTNTKAANIDLENNSDEELNQKTRERFREKLRNGELEQRMVEISIKTSNAPNVGIMGGPVDDLSMMKIEEMLGGMMPKKNKTRKLPIADARKILYEEEMSKLIDMDEVKEEAMRKAEDLGIIFIDEIDKIASNKNGSGADVSREGVQRDLLPIIEGSTVNTKYGSLNTDHVLFIAAGAFHVSKPSDLIPELQGRFPIRVELQNLVKEDFYRILKEPKSALTKQYTALLLTEGVALDFTDEALHALAEIAFEINTEVENIGARRLQTVLSHLLNDIMYDVPDKIPANAQVLITEEFVNERLKGLVKNKDLSHYIL